MSLIPLIFFFLLEVVCCTSYAHEDAHSQVKQNSFEIPCSKQNEYWGYHLILDCQGCVRSEITDREHLNTFIKKLVKEIEMTAYGEPIIEHFAEHDEDKAGFSLVQLIETSSITGHFVDKNGDAYLDIFSCKPFAIETVKKVVIEHFHPEKIKTYYLTRQA